MSAGGAPVPLRERIVRIWFLIDAIVALAPPLYWAADGEVTPILGLPAALFYFVAVSACISASVVFAYWSGARGGERAA